VTTEVGTPECPDLLRLQSLIS